MRFCLRKSIKLSPISPRFLRRNGGIFPQPQAPFPSPLNSRSSFSTPGGGGAEWTMGCCGGKLRPRREMTPRLSSAVERRGFMRRRHQTGPNAGKIAAGDSGEVRDGQEDAQPQRASGSIQPGPMFALRRDGRKNAALRGRRCTGGRP